MYNEKSAAVVGAGGLGCTALYCLAASGVRHITVIDGDTVAASNLNRQLLYGVRDIGKGKAQLAAERLSAQYPDLDIRPVSDFLTDANASLLSGHDIILSCVDSIPARLVINRAALKYRTPLMDAGISGDFLRLTPVLPGVTPCLECFLGDGTDNVCSLPAHGASAVALGAMQARAALRLLDGDAAFATYGTVLADLLNYSFDTVSFARRPDCAACGGGGTPFGDLLSLKGK